MHDKSPLLLEQIVYERTKEFYHKLNCNAAFAQLSKVSQEGVGKLNLLDVCILYGYHSSDVIYKT